MRVHAGLLPVIAVWPVSCGDTAVAPTAQPPMVVQASPSAQPAPTPQPSPSSSTRDDRGATLQRLVAAQTLWNSTRPANYRFTYYSACGCQCCVAYSRVTVRGDRIVGDERVPSNWPAGMNWRPVYTVDDLFGFVHRAAAQSALAITMQYDPQLGHPTSGYVDYTTSFDEELSFTVSQFEPLPD